MPSTLSDHALPNPECDEIAQTADMAARAMKLYLSSKSLSGEIMLDCIAFSA